MTSCYIGPKHFTNIAKAQKTNIIDIAKNINMINFMIYNLYTQGDKHEQ